MPRNLPILSILVCKRIQRKKVVDKLCSAVSFQIIHLQQFHFNMRKGMCLSPAVGGGQTSLTLNWKC